MKPFHSLTIPDFWQQNAVHALRAGKDVVVHAPTGAGKTYVFELLYPNLRGQAIYTVPTRALANDKLAEWQRKGWDVGIATGDVAHRLDARVVVATLETQKARLLEGRGPALLVVDEYQMIADAVRGVNYEVSIAMAPAQTQLLLLSGSVANPEDIVDWLQRIGRAAELVTHKERPVPLQELHTSVLPNETPMGTRGWWARVAGNAVRAELGPLLLFAPRRQAAETLAIQAAAAMPPDRPLSLSREQEQMAGPQLARLLRSRVAFHHSGLPYSVRAGLVEPLAKAGELRVIVATMGLAAGINFSVRSVGVTGTSYMAGPFERQVRPDELLQMYGRAGRRGLDDAGYALVGEQPPRLLDARARHLRRGTPVDWPTLLAVMQAAVRGGKAPLQAAVEVNTRLFATQQVAVGVEHSLETGPQPCGLWVDMERARLARRAMPELWNSQGEWQATAEEAPAPLGQTLVWLPAKGGQNADHPIGKWAPALSLARTLQPFGTGNLVHLPEENGNFGRQLPLGERSEGHLLLAPWLRKALQRRAVEAAELASVVLAKLPALTHGGRPIAVVPEGERLHVRLSYAHVAASAFVDSTGTPLQQPPTREALPLPCRAGGPGGGPCPQLEWCRMVPIADSPAHAWRVLGLISAEGVPTRRGIIFSFFQHGEGLAMAAALEDEGYPLEELVFDLANLRGGPRFAGDEAPASGRLAAACHRAYGRHSYEGYLEMGVPVDYGAGANDAVREMVALGVARGKLVTETIRPGDLERAVLEWRSLLRHIAHAPAEPWERWLGLQRLAQEWSARAEGLTPHALASS